MIAGVSTGDVTEDATTPTSRPPAPSPSATPTKTSPLSPQAATAGSNGYGNFTLAADGSWTYTADNSQAAIQQLGAGQSITDSFTAHSSDGSASQIVTVTIHGTNDVPRHRRRRHRRRHRRRQRHRQPLHRGALTIADADQGQSSFAPQAGTAGSNGYGNFTLAADGSWTYTADNSQTAIQQLGAGQSITDSFTAVSCDGTASQLVTVTIHGTNDAAVIGGVATGDVTEDAGVIANPLHRGALTIADADQGQSNFAPQAATAGSNGYGTFTLAADGSWTYTADNSQTAIQQLGAGQSITDSFTALSPTAPRARSSPSPSTAPTMPRSSAACRPATSPKTSASSPTPLDRGALTIADADRASPTSHRRRHRWQQRLRHLHARRRRQLDLHRRQQPDRDPAARRRPVHHRQLHRRSSTAPTASSSPSPSTAPTMPRDRRRVHRAGFAENLHIIAERRSLIRLRLRDVRPNRLQLYASHQPFCQCAVRGRQPRYSQWRE